MIKFSGPKVWETLLYVDDALMHGSPSEPVYQMRMIRSLLQEIHLWKTAKTFGWRRQQRSQQSFATHFDRWHHIVSWYEHDGKRGRWWGYV